MSNKKSKDDKQAPKRAIIYCRVSTEDQENNSSLADQEKDCREFAAAKNIEVVAVVYEVFTGTKLFERKVLERVREMYKSGVANTVIIRTFDRLSREYEHFAVLSSEMKRYHVELEVAKENVDKTPMGMIARVIMQVLATVEHGKILDRTMTGKRNVVLQKKKIVSSWKPRYGYRYDNPERGKRTCFIINDEEADGVRFIHMKYDAGVSVSDIVRELIVLGMKPPYKAWTRNAVLRVLRYRPYTGKGQFFTEHMYNTEYPMEPVDIPEGIVPQIIDEELFERNQTRLAINQHEAPRNNEHPEDFLLRSGHIYCAECGRRMHGKRRLRGKKKQSVSLTYVCTASSDLNVTIRPCAGQRINTKEIDTMVWEYVELLADDAEAIVHRLRQAIENSDFSDNITAVRNAIHDCERQQGLYEQDLRSPYLQGGARDSTLQHLSMTVQTIENLKIELQKLKAHEVDEIQIKKQYENLAQWFERVQTIDEEMPYAMKRDFLRFLGLKAYVHKVDRRQEVKEIWLDVQLELPGFAKIVLPTMPHMKVLGVGQPATQDEIEKIRELVEHGGQIFNEEEIEAIRTFVVHAEHATQEEIEAIRKLVVHAKHASNEERKEMLAAIENARRTDGIDTENGHIAERALCAQFGTAQQRILGEVPPARVASSDRTTL